MQSVDAGIRASTRPRIQQVIHAGANHFRLCYVTALKKTKDLAGRVETKFVIDETGHVDLRRGRDAFNVLQDDDARACIISKFKLLEFPPPQPSGRVSVTYPMLFDPSMVATETVPDAGAPVARRPRGRVWPRRKAVRRCGGDGGP